MLSTIITETKHIISNFLWELCDEDTDKFTREFGYGNTAGFLVERGLLGNMFGQL
jgi:hypothetical protein